MAWCGIALLRWRRREAIKEGWFDDAFQRPERWLRLPSEKRHDFSARLRRAVKRMCS
ncbi:MAG: hypothetical protein JNL18_10085 [Planctomycetaceae bacterium]|nr:hypothetical protein [Planctomycetaceae bacterium]